MTEAFESHHITPKASQVLPKFYVRDADQPRMYKFTFEETGFYKTLRRRVAEKLKTIDRESEVWKSKLILDLTVVTMFVASILAYRAQSLLAITFWTLIASQGMAWITNFSHNFMHQKDNWRMYTASLTFVSWRDFRVFHAMSHHMYPNTYTDLEITGYEPFLKWIPYSNKTKLGLYLSYLMTPVMYCMVLPGAIYLRYLKSVLNR